MAPPAKISAIKNLDQGTGMRTMQDSGQEFAFQEADIQIQARTRTMR
jgi:hypothetical protein